MGYVIQWGHSIDRRGLKKYRSVDEVVESSGQYEWVTLAKNGKPLTGSDEKPFKIAQPDHSPFTVFQTESEARRFAALNAALDEN